MWAPAGMKAGQIAGSMQVRILSRRYSSSPEPVRSALEQAASPKNSCSMRTATVSLTGKQRRHHHHEDCRDKRSQDEPVEARPRTGAS
jgi:hypothetical protein